MKKVLVILFCVLSLYLTSCIKSKPDDILTNVSESYPRWYIKSESGVSIANIIVLDSCEYIILHQSSNYTRGISHKGNCKFCKERNQLK